jgi:hypothetical protein
MCLVKAGDLNMNQVDAEIRARSYQGNILGENLKGNYICETKTGNVQLELLDIKNLVNVTSNIGNALLFTDQAKDYSIEMMGDNINLVDQGRFKGERNKKSIKGKIGQGGPNIVISSKTGESVLILKAFE